MAGLDQQITRATAQQGTTLPRLIVAAPRSAA
jgi:hypothetical protein